MTISNIGKVTTLEMQVGVYLGDTGLQPEGTNWTGYTGGDRWENTRPAPAPGRSVSLQLGVMRPASRDGLSRQIQIRVYPTEDVGNGTKDTWSMTTSSS